MSFKSPYKEIGMHGPMFYSKKAKPKKRVKSKFKARWHSWNALGNRCKLCGQPRFIVDGLECTKRKAKYIIQH